MILQTTLCLAAAALLINFWLFTRVVRLRQAFKVVHGDGGHQPLLQRMRAQANFIEHAPLFLILVAAIEVSGKGAAWLAIVGSAFLVGRMLHALGMDRTGGNPLRAAGMLITLACELGLAVVAVLIALGRI